jgi:hypothetical protein
MEGCQIMTSLPPLRKKRRNQMGRQVKVGRQAWKMEELDDPRLAASNLSPS